MVELVTVVHLSYHNHKLTHEKMIKTLLAPWRCQNLKKQLSIKLNT